MTSSFCVIVLDHGIRPTLDSPALLGHGVELRLDVPFSLDNWWADQVGKGRARLFAQPQLAVMARCSDALLARGLAHHGLWSLLPFLAGRFGSAECCEGTATAAQYRVNAMVAIDSCLVEGGLRHHPVTDSLVQQVKPAFDVIDRWAKAEHDHHHSLFPTSTPDEHHRLMRGFREIVEGAQISDSLRRVGCFVRALEAVVVPPKGRSARVFAHRANLLASRSSESRSILLECYDLRSARQHHGDVSSFPIRTRSAQAEYLACEVYRRILTKPALLSAFNTDSSTRALWEDDAILKIWGPPIPIEESSLRSQGVLVP